MAEVLIRSVGIQKVRIQKEKKKKRKHYLRMQGMKPQKPETTQAGGAS